MTNAVRLHRSPVIPDGFVHGFPERSGGVSTGARASLNLGKRWGDTAENVDENRRRLAEHAGYEPNQLQIMRHVHGTNVWKVGEPYPEPAEFDGLVTAEVGPVLAAFAADCIPLLFAEPDARVAGSAHAGWRGTVGVSMPDEAGNVTRGPSVATRVVERMVELGAQADRIRVALGPSIGVCCFEVGPEVVAEFRRVYGELHGLVVHNDASGKDHIDLRVAMRANLERAGVRPEHIDTEPPCTRCDERFFSYRRDGRDGGMHMAFIGIRG